MGDPETEVVIPRIKSDLLDLLEGVATKTLSERDVQFSEHCASTVMMVSGGYPSTYQKGKIIYGLNAVTDALVFHAGTTSDGPQVVTNGGRVLAVTSFGKTLEQALERSYAGIAKISYENAYFRRDIGKDVI
jgi:phosphoribosylamine--glycine ligase